MKRRSKASGGQIKGRRRKASVPNRGNVPKAVARSNSLTAGKAEEFARLVRELGEALERQAATTELLQVINSSYGDLQLVFQTMLASAVRLCQATFGVLWLAEGNRFRSVALHNLPPAFAAARQREPVVYFGPKSGTGRLIEKKQIFQIDDLTKDSGYIERDPRIIPLVELGGARTALFAPLLKVNHVIGSLVLYRQMVCPFGDKQIELVKNFAAQAVIAIENARLLNELRQSLERQTATSDVLQAINSSPGDVEPVFATMLENAVRICDTTFGNIYRADGDGLSNVATHNTPTAFAEALRSSPYFSPGPKNPVRRMMTAKDVVHVVDVAATEAYVEREPIAVASVELGGTRTLMIVPMLRDNELVGAFTLARQDVRPFTDEQIALVKNFATQAVIAIENARLLIELRQRTADLTEALEQQTATSEVLKVISSSPGELAPVFATLLAEATELCQAKFGSLFLLDEDVFNVGATYIPPSAGTQPGTRIVIGENPGIPLARILQTKQLLHIADLRTDQSYIERNARIVSLVERAGARTLLAVPMLKGAELIGAITIYRDEVRDFTDKQIGLVTNFAAQAVITHVC